MSISVKTRKILWSKSGNRCAICKNPLVHKMELENANFIVGEECHIVSSKENGPRGRSRKLKNYDEYENLILLCANDHKLIDEFPETFTIEIIESIKDNHELWIESAIEKDLHEYIKSINNIEFLDEIKTQSDIEVILQNSHFYLFDFSSLKNDLDKIKVSELFDDFRDYGDFYSDLEYSNKTKILINYVDFMKEMNNKGIRFFGKSIIREYKFINTSKSKYEVSIIIAFQENVNPLSIEKGKLMIKLPDDFTPKL